MTKTRVELVAAAAALVAALEGDAKIAYEAREQELGVKGFGALGAELARVPLLRDTFAVMAAARDANVDLGAAAALFHRDGKTLHLDAFSEILAAQIPANPWERRFFISLEREAAAVRQRAVLKLTTSAGELALARGERVARIGDALRMVRQSGANGLVPLFLILEEYRGVLDDDSAVPLPPPSMAHV